MRVGESREIIAALLVLRWIDLRDAEDEAMAAFEERPHQLSLPRTLQWRHWTRFDAPDASVSCLSELIRHVAGLRGEADQPTMAYLHVLADPLRRLAHLGPSHRLELVRMVTELPFDTPSERQALLELFDQAMAETGEARDGLHATPASIARLVAALANPQPGERVYDPCFGSGNFLVAAWQLAGRNRLEQRRPGALLDVAGIELDAGAFLIGLARMLLAGVDSPRLELGDSLEREALSSPGQQGFDVVLANPPIGAKTNREPARYRQFAIATNDSTGLFVQHALLQLKPNGRAVIVVPEGFLFRGGAERDLRRHLLEEGHVEAVIGLPAGALAPFASIKLSLLVLRKQGDSKRVRMIDATALFEQRSGRKSPVIGADMAGQLAADLRRPELRKPVRGHEDPTPGRGLISRLFWELSLEELAAADWDLSARRRERGGLDDLLRGLQDSLGERTPVVALADVSDVFAGRSVKSTDLLEEPPPEGAIGYVRIRDLMHGHVGRVSSWLRPEQSSQELRWALLSGDLLLSKSGTIGKSALVRNGAVGSVAANGLYVVRVDRERLDAGFLLAYLASPACQNWLAAQSHGAAIQHLNRTALNRLPVPLPPLQMQARAAAQFRDFGTDALTFLSQATESSESDRLSTWLAELDSRVPKFTAGLDVTPALSLFEPIVALVNKARNWVAHEQVSSHSGRWLMPLNQALLPLSGVGQIPPGSGLLTVLQEAERGVQAVLDQTTGHLPAESQARAIAERLREWLRAALSDLNSVVGLRVRTSPDYLAAGTFAEFSVELENTGALPLRNVRVASQPDWGVGEVAYLPERSAFAIHLRGDVPKRGTDLSLRLAWHARALSGQQVEDEIELAIRVEEAGLNAGAATQELGGSPYVTGSPLAPQHGHRVFYGRDDLIATVSRQIATNGNVVLLEGNRRAGKTSILKHLEGRSAIPGWIAIYCSLQGAEGDSRVVGVPTVEVFREFARSIAQALTRQLMDVPLPNGHVIETGRPALGIAKACREGIGTESPFVDFRDYLEVVLVAMQPLGLGLVLMLDEFDKLQEGIDNGVTSPQVPENIRFLIQNYARFSAVLTGSRRLKRLREEYWSALYGLGTSVQVTALDTESARKVVVEPVQDRLTYSQEAIDRVLEVTARHPYLMQCLCNRVFDYAVQSKSRSVTVSLVNAAATSLVRDNEHFASLWDYAALGPETGSHRRQMILLLCARSLKEGTHIGFGALQELLAQVGVFVMDEALDVDLTYLRELELIDFAGEIGGGEYRLAIPLMADWIEQQQDYEVLASRVRAETEGENA